MVSYELWLVVISILLIISGSIIVSYHNRMSKCPECAASDDEYGFIYGWFTLTIAVITLLLIMLKKYHS